MHPVKPSSPFRFSNPADALAAITARLEPVPSEPIDLARASGRVLAQSASTDRPSPPMDVSAVDGYAVRLADLARDSLPVLGELPIGHPPQALSAGGAMRVVTGGVVPPQADLVVMREHVADQHGRIQLRQPREFRSGENIRRRGENAPQGFHAAVDGSVVTAPIAGFLASAGLVRPLVRRRVRACIITTGDELLDPADPSPPDPWRIRDSNGAALRSLLAPHPWIELHEHARLSDDPARLTEALGRAIEASDAVLITGGVSMGDRDFVPGALSALGAEVLFHKLPQRPGKPVLAAIAGGPHGPRKPIFALPGNPVSVMVVARRIALPALRRLAGLRGDLDGATLVSIPQADGAVLADLWWHRLVRRTGPGVAEVVAGRSSGDVVSACTSDGFIEVPPGEAAGAEPRRFFAWAWAG